MKVWLITEGQHFPENDSAKVQSFAWPFSSFKKAHDAIADKVRDVVREDYEGSDKTEKEIEEIVDGVLSSGGPKFFDYDGNDRSATWSIIESEVE